LIPVDECLILADECLILVDECLILIHSQYGSDNPAGARQSETGSLNSVQGRHFVPRAQRRSLHAPLMAHVARVTAHR
jgi:hypothetical protein